jgi:tRNA-dihydrouridine synthase A
MRAAVSIPVTVKCRLGIDEQVPQQALREMIERCEGAGVTTFIVHARKAWLDGLSPRENREVPPLDYELVYAVKREKPQLEIVINGGIASLDECEEHLARVDGVMLGRTAYHSPAILSAADRRFFGDEMNDVDAAVAAYMDYAERKLADGVPLNAMIRPMLGLFNGQPGARQFRRHLSENASRKGAGIETLRAALALVSQLEAEAA